MLRIRLSRVGRKHDPSYRMIVTEKGRGPQTGNYVEQVGTYDARSDEHDLKSDRITYWIDNGAQPSDTVHNLLVKAGVIEADTVNPLPKKTPIAKENEATEGEAEEVDKDEDKEVEENDKPSQNDDDDDEDTDESSTDEKEPEEGTEESES